jgi:gamma-glutamylcyclotransferase
VAGSNTNYFAYGSNLSAAEMQRRAPGSTNLGVARLSSYRLAFTRVSSRRGGGVADVVPSKGFSVYGVLWEVPNDGMNQLDREEGVPDAYRRETVVCRLGDRSVNAVTYRVSNPSHEEIAPNPDYLNIIVTAAKDQGLPADYISFLRYLQTVFGDGSRDIGLLLGETVDRHASHGQPLVRLNVEDAVAVSGSSFAVIRLSQDRDAQAWALAKLDVSSEVVSGTCEADQTVRASLGFPLRYCYGHRVVIQKALGEVPGWSPIEPRSLMLSLHSPSGLDTEKNYCVLHPASISALGLQPGNYLRLYVALSSKAGDSPAEVHSTSLRVFSGIGTSVERPTGPAPYPIPTEVYVDEDGRQQLKLPGGGWVGRPILVRPDLWRAMSNRVLFYGVTVLLGISAFFQLLQAFFPQLSLLLQGIVSLAVSVVVTVALAVLDLRASLHY